MSKELALWHNHTEYSNLEFKDSIIRVEQLIDYAIELGLSGIGITEHGNLSSHIKALNHLEKLRKQLDEELKNNENDVNLLARKEQLDNFRLGLGSEIYLVDRETISDAKEKNERTKFYHFILIAKNKEGYRTLAKLSTKSWEESFYFRGLNRVPTYKEVFKEILSESKGNIIGSSACLGSEFSKLVLEYCETNSIEKANEIMKFIDEMKDIFGQDFYIEIQPSTSIEQVTYNKMALQIAKSMDVKVIVTTDAHYLKEEDREVHSIYLKSQNAEREVDSFYQTTFIMDYDNLRKYFDYLDDATFDEIVGNTIEINNSIQNYNLNKSTQVPKATIKLDNEFVSFLPNIGGLEEHCPYIVKFMNSEYEIDRVFLQLIEKGMKEKNQEYNATNLKRINEELMALWEISEKLGQRLSSYYVLTREIVDLMWETSLVGVARGSAGAFYVCYLTNITQINPLKMNGDLGIPSWRHISKERVELPDIDLDSESSQRQNILKLIKEKYGHSKVLNIATFKTEGTRSAIQSACRGLGISVSDSNYYSSLVVMDGATPKSLSDCIKEYDTSVECRTLIDELSKEDRLIETILKIEKLVCGKGIHASGVYIFPCECYEMNAMMCAPNLQPITQYSMQDSDQQGGLKLDQLTIEGLDRIRKTLNLLLEENIVEWKGSLRETYNEYLHPDSLEYDAPKMWEMLYTGEVINAFQMETLVGASALRKVKPNTLDQVIATNSLMRLSCEGEQPIDSYCRHKEDINLWYKEMKDYGLNEDEMSTLKEILGINYGVAVTQEDAMILAMSPKIANFTLTQANKLRKTIAKSKAKHLILEIKNEFYLKGMNNGNRKVILEYVWEMCIVPMLG